ncbi:MAG: hypothetical protein AAGB13_06425 [Cyanobacteria bacterium P01_F01_bin.33]
MFVLGALFVVGFAAAALLGSQTYFRGEQSKPIHWRNWQSSEFHQLAETFTGSRVDYRDRASSPFVETVLDRIGAASS